MPSDRATARLCLLDWIAVTVAAASSAEMAPLLRIIEAEGAHPVSTLIGVGAKASMRQAALFNGTASHLYDYDDVHVDIPGHATTPIAPALWAVAEARGIPAERVVDALIVGIEIICRLGRSVSPMHYAAGWHASATIGTLAAAAATSRLLGLSNEQCASAIGFAVSMTAGLRGAFGSVAKPFQIGNAAENGLFSALLAQGGMIAHSDMIERADGFFAVFGRDRDPMPTPPGAVPAAIRGVQFKRYAACYLMHAALDALVSDVESHAIRPKDIESLTLVGAPEFAAVCDRPIVLSRHDPRFSVQFAIAALLSGRDLADIRTYDVASHLIRRDLMDRINVLADDGHSMEMCSLTINLKDGRRVSSIGTRRPQPSIDAQRTFVRAKAEILIGANLGAERAAQLIAAVTTPFPGSLLPRI